MSANSDMVKDICDSIITHPDKWRYDNIIEKGYFILYYENQTLVQLLIAKGFWRLRMQSPYTVKFTICEKLKIHRAMRLWNKYKRAKHKEEIKKQADAVSHTLARVL